MKDKDFEKQLIALAFAVAITTLILEDVFANHPKIVLAALTKYFKEKGIKEDSENA